MFRFVWVRLKSARHSPSLPKPTGLAMVCDQRNLTLPNERYSLTSTDYDSMTPVTGSPVTIGGLRIEKQVQPSVFMVNSTFWRLHVNVTTNPFGVCNGTVIFAAESP